jgi:hypothetical protein
MPARASTETLLSLLRTHAAESPHGNLRERHGALRLCRLWPGDLKLAIDSGQRCHALAECQPRGLRLTIAELTQMLQQEVDLVGRHVG